MSLILILICLGVQRLLHINAYQYQTSWVAPYYHWMESKFTIIKQGDGMVATLVLLLPLLLVLALVFILVRSAIGVVGYYILDLVLLWFCLDARDMKKQPYQGITVEQYFKRCYHGLFAILFWFILLGPFGVGVYFLITALVEYFQQCEALKTTTTVQVLQVMQQALDWLPARLLGLSFALVGSFAAVMKSWVQNLPVHLKQTTSLVTEWGEMAIEKAHIELVKQEKSAVISLLDRALLVWLVIIALVSIGIWLG